MAMACPIKKEKIQEKKDRIQQAEREKTIKPYSEVIKKTVQETQNKVAPTQIILGTDYSYKITICIIHAHFINMARPGSYEATLNKMLRANGLPTVTVPGEIPSEDLFGAKVATNMEAAESQDSVLTGASGFQEEGFDDMMELGEGDRGRKDVGAAGKGEQPREQRTVRPKEPRVEKIMSQRRVYRSMEELPLVPIEKRREIEVKGGEEKPSQREKEAQMKKSTEIEAKTLGLHIYAAESRPFPKQITYEGLVEGIKTGCFKFIFSAKRTEQEILNLIEKKKVKIFEDDLQVISDETFRKVRGGKEPTPPGKLSKKPWQR